MPNRRAGRKGTSGIGFLLTLAVLGAAIYAGLKLATPYYAYRDFQAAIRTQARMSLYSGDRNFVELRQVIREKIENHRIPLREDQVRIDFDPVQRLLTVSAEYRVDVEFPGYVYRYHFAPFARVQAQAGGQVRSVDEGDS